MNLLPILIRSNISRYLIASAASAMTQPTIFPRAATSNLISPPPSPPSPPSRHFSLCSVPSSRGPLALSASPPSRVSPPPHPSPPPTPPPPTSLPLTPPSAPKTKAPGSPVPSVILRASSRSVKWPMSPSASPPSAAPVKATAPCVPASCTNAANVVSLKPIFFSPHLPMNGLEK